MTATQWFLMSLPVSVHCGWTAAAALVNANSMLALAAREGRVAYPTQVCAVAASSLSRCLSRSSTVSQQPVSSLDPVSVHGCCYISTGANLAPLCGQRATRSSTSVLWLWPTSVGQLCFVKDLWGNIG
jgi:hypothetical protein